MIEPRPTTHKEGGGETWPTAANGGLRQHSACESCPLKKDKMAGSWHSGGLEALRLGCWLGLKGMPNGRLEIGGGLEECYRKSHTLDAQERSVD